MKPDSSPAASVTLSSRYVLHQHSRAVRRRVVTNVSSPGKAIQGAMRLRIASMSAASRRVIAALVCVALAMTACSSAPSATTEPAVDPSIPAPERAYPQQISYGELAGQYGWLDTPDQTTPDSGYPVVILVHGGFWSEPWDHTLMSPLAQDLVANGYATWNIEFRRLGGTGGFPETFDDVAAAVDALAQADDANLDLERTIVVGHSSGGHLALWALGRDDSAVQLRGAVGLGAITDLEAFPQAQTLLGGDAATYPDRYLAAAPELDPERVVLIHGESDRIVPRSSLAKAELIGTPIIDVSDTDHFMLINPSSDAWRITREHINDIIGPGAQ